MASIDGTPGNDTLTGTAGNDTFDGFGGADKVQIAAPSGTATFSLDAQHHWVVSSPQGVDTLLGSEAVQFTDATVTPANETRVNSATAGPQTTASVALLKDGSYIVAWAGLDEDFAYSYGIFTQRFDAGGHAIGAQTLVNSGTPAPNFGYSSAIAPLAGGGYVVTWTAFTSGDETHQWWDVYAQRFDASGAPVGDQARVNSTTTGNQYTAADAIAPLPDGGYIVTWSSSLAGFPAQSGENFGGFWYQRFDAAGARVGAESLIEGGNPFYPANSAIVSLYSGGFVATWTEDDAIRQFRVDAGGQLIGGKTTVASGVDRGETAMAALWDGGWVVAYAAGGDIQTQRYDSQGARVGEGVRVNTTTADSQDSPTIAALPDGGYVVAWQSWNQDGMYHGIYAQRFSANGAMAAPETLVNTFTQDDQTNPDITATADGGWVITWSSLGQDGADGPGVYAQRYDSGGTPLSSGTALVGDAHDNTLHFAGGPMELVGGAGLDTAVLDLSASQVTGYSRAGGNVTLASTAGAQSLIDIERVQLGNGLYALDTSGPSYAAPAGHAWEAAALYHLAFGSLPGLADLSHWTAQADDSASMGVLAQKMIDQYAPGISADSLVAYVYSQLVHVQPSPETVRTFVDQIGPGKAWASQADLVAFAASHALNTDAMVGFVGSVQPLDSAYFT
ncbi:MAG: uncharacterized protein JWQ07_3617 [Ramlibacter sp.]|nr:uncharacterized protein [Ramlibacter sp.]